MQHYDIDGNPVSLLKLIRAEPEWAQSQIITLRATISRLREYARHTPGCIWQRRHDLGECDCGYNALMAEVGEGK